MSPILPGQYGQFHGNQGALCRGPEVTDIEREREENVEAFLAFLKG